MITSARGVPFRMLLRRSPRIVAGFPKQIIAACAGTAHPLSMIATPTNVAASLDLAIWSPYFGRRLLSKTLGLWVVRDY
jgi:hypothetical protein